MAYVAQNPDDPESQQGASPTGTNPPTTSASAAVTPTGVGASNAAQTSNQAQNATPQSKGGSQFGDISAYLTQNQNAGNRLASQIGNQVVGAGNQADTDIKNAQGTFNQGVQSNTLPYNQSLVNQYAANPTSLYNFQPLTAGSPPPTRYQLPNPLHMNAAPTIAPYITRPTPTQAPTTPGTVTNPADYAALEAQLSGAYNGPQDLTGQAGYTGAQNDIASANSMANNTNNIIGQQDLLKSVYGNDVTPGSAMNLDELLLGNGGAQNILQNASARNAGLPGQLSDANTAATTAAQAAAANNASDASQANAAFTNALGGLNQNVASELAAARPQYRSDIGNTLTDADVATPQDYYKLQAINQILGQNNAI